MVLTCYLIIVTVSGEWGEEVIIQNLDIRPAAF